MDLGGLRYVPTLSEYGMSSYSLRIFRIVIEISSYLGPKTYNERICILKIKSISHMLCVL